VEFCQDRSVAFLICHRFFIFGLLLDLYLHINNGILSPPLCCALSRLADKDRQCYLGNSLMAPVGRWQNGKDLTWYAKGDSNTLARTMEEERRAVQEEERQRMAEALYVISTRFHWTLMASLFFSLQPLSIKLIVL
jgi:hypothetical protein